VNSLQAMDAKGFGPKLWLVFAKMNQQ